MFNFLKKKQVWIPVVAILVLAILVSLFRADDDRERIDFSEVIAAARDGKVERIEVHGATLRVTLTGEGEIAYSRMDRDTAILDLLQNEGVTVGGPDGVELDFRDPPAVGTWVGVLINFLPLALYLPLTYLILYHIVRNGVAEGIRRSRRDEPSL